MVGEQFGPVRSTVPAPEPRKTLLRSCASAATASAMEEFGTSRITSTPSWSNQRRAMANPMSGLFWWSAEISSTGRPASPALSSTANCAATTEPRPW